MFQLGFLMLCDDLAPSSLAISLIQSCCYRYWLIVIDDHAIDYQSTKYIHCD